MNNNWKQYFFISLILTGSAVIFGVIIILDLQSTLSSTKESLSRTETELQESISQHNLTKIQLTSTRDQLASVRNQLNTTESQLVTIQNRLDQTKSELSYARTEIERKTSDINLMSTQYGTLKNTVNSRFGLTKEDRQSYVTPSDPAVSAKVLEITNGYSDDNDERWNDYESMYRWIVKNITYSYDSYMPVLPSSISGTVTWIDSCWRFPAETLTDKTGDCEDMALLLQSMMLSYNKNQFTVWAIVISSTEAGKPGHMGVALPVKGGKLTIFDPAGKYFTSIYDSVYSETSSTAINNWLAQWNSEIPGAYISSILSKETDQKFSNTGTFLTWLAQR